MTADYCLHTVHKRCILQYEGCVGEWDGPAFTPQPSGAAPLPGICANCGPKEDAAYERLLHPVREVSSTALPDLAPPRRAPEDA